MTSITTLKPATKAYSDFANAYLESSWPKRLNLNIDLLTPVNCQLRLPYSEEINNGTSAIHGGIIASAMHDAGLLLATHAFSDKQQLTVRTIDFKVSFLRAAKETDLTIDATILRQSKRMAFINVVATDKSGQPVASVNCSFGTWEEEASTPISPDLYVPLLNKQVADHSLKHMMKSVVESRVEGMAVEEMGEGFCRMRLDNIACYQDQHGYISSGAQLTLVDNVGAFGALAGINAMGMGSTVDISLTSCEAVKDENLIGVAEAMARRGSQISSRVSVISEKSQRLIAFGTVSLWVKF
ncbi:MAG: hypothetical protein COB04_11705 [Gammaproteobacteria bacterium]|nr:MAG: hypothetical protein COB04_11705 [Gammaproteobacteria bacterium]